MKSDFPRDPAQSIDTISELSRTALDLREAMMQSQRSELLAIFETYIHAHGEIINPKFNVLLLGFQEAWREGNFTCIVAVGDKLSKDFLLRWREAQAYYAMALARVGREKLRLT